MASAGNAGVLTRYGPDGTIMMRSPYEEGEIGRDISEIDTPPGQKPSLSSAEKPRPRCRSSAVAQSSRSFVRRAGAGIHASIGSKQRVA